MSLFNQLIPNYTLNDKRQIRVAPQMPEPVYIDDAFDPLFNKRAQAYLNDKYGRFLRIPGGYAEMIENMLGNSTKQWGPLGPGMGILGTFGRTIDKAEDFLLGGVTEASHLAGNLNPLGSYTPVKNPLSEVFVEDKDYTGQKLLASMSNNMSRLAGGTALTENDFNGAWNIPSLGIELATDPGILGGALSRNYAPMVELADDAGYSKMVPLQKAAQSGRYSSSDILDMLSKETNIKSAVGEAGQLMSNFDDVLARLSWDVTAPGLRPAVGKLIDRLDNLLASDRMSQYVNVNIKKLKEIEDLENLIKNYEDARAEGPVKRLKIYKNEAYGTSEKLLDNLKEIKQKLAKTDINTDVDFNVDNSFNEIRTKISRILSKLDFDENTYYAQVLNDIYNTNFDFKTINKLEIPSILEEFKRTRSLNISDDLKKALKPYTSELMTNDSKVFKKLTDLQNAFDNYVRFKNNDDLYKQIAEVIKLQEGSENELKNYVQSFANDFSTGVNLNQSASAFKEYLLTHSRKELKEYKPIELTEQDFEDAVYETYRKEKYMGDGSDGFENPSFDEAEFWKNIKKPDTKEYAKLTERINRLKSLSTNSPIRANVNRFRVIQDTYQRTPILELYKRKFASIAKNVSNGNQEMFNKLLKAFEYGNFDEILKIMQSSKYKQLFDIYRKANPIEFLNPKDLKILEEGLQSKGYSDEYISELLNDPKELVKTIDSNLYENYKDILPKKGYPFLETKKGYIDFENFHKELRDFTDLFIKDYNPVTSPKFLDDFKISMHNEPIVDEIKTLSDARRYFKLKNIDLDKLAQDFGKAENVTDEFRPLLAKILKFSDDFDNLYKDFYDLRQLTDLVQVGASNVNDTLDSTSKALNKQFKDFLKNEKVDIFTKANGDFNFEFYSLLKEKFPYINFYFNDDVVKYRYGKSAEEMEELAKIITPNLYQSPTFDLVFKKGKDGSKKLDYNNINNFYTVLNSKDPYKYVTFSDNFTKDKYKTNLEKQLNANINALDTAVMETPAMNFELLFEDVANPNLVKASEAISEYTGIPIKEVRDNIEKIKNRISKYNENADFYTKVNLMMNNEYVLNRHTNTKASVRAAKQELKALENYRGTFFKNYLSRNPKAKVAEIQKAWEGFGEIYLDARARAIGDILPKEKFLHEFVDSHGLLLGKYAPDTVPAGLVEAIYNNARILNSKANIVVPIDVVFDSNRYIGLKLNTSEKDLIKLFKKNVNIDDFNNFMDIPFAIPENVDMTKYIQENELINNVNQKATDFYKTFGIEASPSYVKQKYTHTDKADSALHKMFKGIGIDDISDVRSAGRVIQEMYNEHGPFMVFNSAKSLRGGIGRWNKLGPVFETDLTKVAKSTFTDGIFEEHKVQTFIDLCLNDNTKVSSWAKDWQDLKRIINAKDLYGKESGNLKNMVLASAVFDKDTGTFVKFKKYDMLTDKGIQEAFENNAFYVPKNMFASLDKMIKKDAKMTNSLYQFINKYLMLPFKFGTLANPGFLVGNFSDAYMKQALTLSQKYGTSVAEEFANVSESLMDIVHLNNKFDEIYRTRFLADIGEQAIKENPYLKITSKVFDDDNVAKRFSNWYEVNKNTLTKLERDNVDLMLYINRYIPTMTGDFASLELDEASKFLKGNKWEQPKSFVEKRLMGNHYNSKNITTWGLLAGNPVSNTIMRYSGDIETLFRSASVLNDLKHQYKNLDGLRQVIGLSPEEFTKRHKELSAKTLDAINLMNAANFNYDNISDFMQGVSYAMPFPTFYLKNIGYWLEVLEEHPEYIDTIVNTQNTMWNGIDTTKDNFQAEAKGRGSLPMSSIIGQKPSKVFKGVLKPTMTNSMFSAFSTINNPVKDIANRVNPTMSNLTRHLQDPENVRYRPYSTDLYEKNIKQGDKNFNSLAYTFHRLNPYDRFLNTYLRTPAKIKTNQAQMSDFLPSIFQPDYSRKEKAKK